MAEVFGAITGALSVITLFNFCVDGFKYVQVGRDFGRGYERFQVKLETEKRRLLQWGRSVGIRDDSRFREMSPGDDSIQFIQSILQQLKILFDSVRDSTRGYEVAAAPRDAVTSKSSRLFDWPRAQKPPTRKSRLKWALWDKEHLGELVKQITEFVDALEKLYPGEPVPRRRLASDVQDIGNSLRGLVLEDASSSRSDMLLECSADNVEDAGGNWLSPPVMSQESSTTHQPAGTWLGDYTQQRLPSSQSYTTLETNWDFTTPGRRPFQHHDVWPRSDGDTNHFSQFDTLGPTSSSVGRGSISSAPMVSPSQDHSPPWQNNIVPRRYSEPNRVISPPVHKHSAKHSSKSKKSQQESGGYVLETNLEGSTITAVVVEHRQIAYLTRSKVHLFAFTWEDGLYEICSQDLSYDLNSQQSQRVKWKGIAQSGDYLASWGVCNESEQSLLSVFVLQGDASGGYVLTKVELPYSGDTSLESFDTWKRVAVSSTGCVACIKNTRILLIDVRNGCRVSVLESPYPDEEFIDIAFDEKGSFLYAWGMMKIYGALTTWDVQNLYDTSPISVSYYECDTNESIHETRLFPYPNSLGCVVSASANKLFFPGILEHGSQGKIQPRGVSDELRKSKVRAACMSNDYSFIAIRKFGGLRKEYRIGEYNIRVGKAPSLRESQELYKLVREPLKESQVGIFQDGNTRTILVCHLDGKVEVANLGPQ